MTNVSRGASFSLSRSSRHQTDENSETFRISTTTINSGKKTLPYYQSNSYQSPSPLKTGNSLAIENTNRSKASLTEHQKSRLLEIIYAANSIADQEPTASLQRKHSDDLLESLPSPLACNSSKREIYSSEKNTYQPSTRRVGVHALNEISNTVNTSPGERGCSPLEKHHSSINQYPSCKEIQTSLGWEIEDSISQPQLTSTTTAESVSTKYQFPSREATLNLAELMNEYWSLKRSIHQDSRAASCDSRHEDGKAPYFLLKKQKKDSMGSLSDFNSLMQKQTSRRYNTLKTAHSTSCISLENSKIKSVSLPKKGRRKEPNTTIKSGLRGQQPLSKPFRKKFYDLEPHDITAENLNLKQGARKPAALMKQQKRIASEERENNDVNISFCLGSGIKNQANFRSTEDDFMGQTASFEFRKTHKNFDVASKLKLIIQKMEGKLQSNQTEIQKLKQAKDEGLEKYQRLTSHLKYLTEEYYYGKPRRLDSQERSTTAQTQESTSTQRNSSIASQAQLRDHLKTLSINTQKKLKSEKERLQKLEVLYEILTKQKMKEEEQLKARSIHTDERTSKSNFDSIKHWEDSCFTNTSINPTHQDSTQSIRKSFPKIKGLKSRSTSVDDYSESNW